MVLDRVDCDAAWRLLSLGPLASEELLHRSARTHYLELTPCSGALARAQKLDIAFSSSSTWLPQSPGLDQGPQRFTSFGPMDLTSKVGKCLKYLLHLLCMATTLHSILLASLAPAPVLIVITQSVFLSSRTLANHALFPAFAR